MATASRSSTAAGRAQESLPPINETNNNSTSTSQSREPRTTKGPSLGFLRRSKSTEPLGERKLSGKSKKRAQILEEERRQREARPRHAPRLPDLSPAPTLETFGGEREEEEEEGGGGERPDSVAMASLQQHYTPGSAISSPTASVYPDPYARTESMTHRGRFSYASSAVSSSRNPRRLRRRKDPTPYNILVIGARNSGKTSFLNFLRESLAMPPHKHPTRTPEEQEEIERYSGTSEGYTSHYLETEIDGERVGLTLWDSQGLERSIVDIQLRGVTGFLEGKFEETLREEMKVIRSPGVRDTHIHCTFLVLDPVRLDENIAAAERAAQGTSKASDSPVVGILDQYLDLQVLRTVLGKTTVVPIISKADTITTAHMAYLRKAVWNSLKKANIDPLEVLTLEDQEEYTSSDSADEEEARPEQPEATPDAEEPNGDAAPVATESEPVPEGAEEEEEQQQQQQQPQESERSHHLNSGSQAVAQNLPFSILSPDPHSLAAGDKPVGRRFAWGFADPYNPEHCDFVKLKNSVFSDWRSELREASRVIWYENWRTSRLNRNGVNVVPQQRKVFGGRMGPADDGRRTR